ncbi:hypothetical protein MINT15_31510 [Saccharomonospora viridis]|uniref:Uncharacterized protein n=1 Tax=Saccharomonospora viridis TaxID=1852 RepID=A0A837D543_9PSEU|nr:hypothetical protein MINT15_31510 [Saccharomonospora viridis]
MTGPARGLARVLDERTSIPTEDGGTASPRCPPLGLRYWP